MHRQRGDARATRRPVQIVVAERCVIVSPAPRVRVPFGTEARIDFQRRAALCRRDRTAAGDAEFGQFLDGES